MARKPDYRDFYNLITVFIALILGTTKFLIEVNKHGLWKECILSVGFVGGFNYLLYYL
ncbi:unknown [Fusobacterium sp. CAG:439]|nr:unknown [Fusobacterium sp. CAG:439]